MTAARRTTRLGPFVVRVDHADRTWRARSARLVALERAGRRRDGTWWAPGAVGWWTGVLFALGSACFAIGAAPGYVRTVGGRVDSWTFFVGSVFFTTAAALTYAQAVAAEGAPGVAPSPRRGVRPERLGWWAATVQLAGTVAFNVSTGAAVVAPASAVRSDRVGWLPDVAGSACFLVASVVAVAEERASADGGRVRRLGWWVTSLNLAGSVAFAASAVGAYVVPATGLLRNAVLSGLGTFVGALCFLAAAVLLLPERTAARR